MVRYQLVNQLSPLIDVNDSSSITIMIVNYTDIIDLFVLLMIYLNQRKLMIRKRKERQRVRDKRSRRERKSIIEGGRRQEREIKIEMRDKVDDHKEKRREKRTNR